MSDLLISIITMTLAFSAPLMLGARGGMFSERAGIANIGIEGFMTVGAFSFAMYMNFYGSNDITSMIIGIISAMIVSMLFGLIFAYITVTLKADHIVSGIAINGLALGLTLFITRSI